MSAHLYIADVYKNINSNRHLSEKSQKHRRFQFHLSYGIPWSADLKEDELFQNLRLELLNNKFASFPELQLRDISKQCSQMFNVKYRSTEFCSVFFCVL